MRGLFDHSMSVGDAIGWGATTLDESDGVFRNSRADATLLLRHVLQIPHAELFAYRDRHLTQPQLQIFQELIDQRAKGRPIQYITGEQEFFGLPLRITPDVLIPRPETEHLVEAAIARLQNLPAPRIVDVGTGSGAIAIALAHSLPHAEIVALDISHPALAVAQLNAKENGVAENILFVESDLLTVVASERFDAVVSNPPYVALSERASLAREVRDFEPPQALFAGPTGLEIYPRLIAQAGAVLKPGGWLLLEIGHGQGDAVANLVRGWTAVEFIPDLQGIPRVALARKP